MGRISYAFTTSEGCAGPSDDPVDQDDQRQGDGPVQYSIFKDVLDVVSLVSLAALLGTESLSERHGVVAMGAVRVLRESEGHESREYLSLYNRVAVRN